MSQACHTHLIFFGDIFESECDRVIKPSPVDEKRLLFKSEDPRGEEGWVGWWVGPGLVLGFGLALAWVLPQSAEII